MKERFLSIIIAIVVGTVLLLLLPPGPSQRLQDAVRFFTTPVQTWSDCTARVAAAFLNLKNDHIDQQAKEENIALRQMQLEVTALRAHAVKLQQDAQRQGINLDAFHQTFIATCAKVIKRDPIQSYHDYIIINQGANDGIKVGNFVVALPTKSPALDDPPKLIGIVQTVAATSAKVILTTNPDVAIPCTVLNKRIDGVLVAQELVDETGTSIHKAKPLILLATPSGQDYDAVKTGDIVITSEHGDNPNAVPNIYVGHIASISQGEQGMPSAVLKLTEPTENLTHVMVILAKNKR